VVIIKKLKSGDMNNQFNERKKEGRIYWMNKPTSVYDTETFSVILRSKQKLDKHPGNFLVATPLIAAKTLGFY
jgi:hypothetical protein